MYVYIKSEPSLWTVGFYDPKGEWHPESDWNSEEEAAARIHYLDGGGLKEPEPTPSAEPHMDDLERMVRKNLAEVGREYEEVKAQFEAIDKEHYRLRCLLASKNRQSIALSEFLHAFYPEPDVEPDAESDREEKTDNAGMEDLRIGSQLQQMNEALREMEQ